MGGMMGWRAADVRACSMSDFAHLVNGWLKAHGVDPDDGGDRPTLDDLDDLIERYG
jgi:hypothetical protein